MKFTEVNHPSVQKITESVERGVITESQGKIMHTHGDADAWSEPMNLAQALSEDQRILREAGIPWQ
jgi:hypothetical protein